MIATPVAGPPLSLRGRGQGDYHRHLVRVKGDGKACTVLIRKVFVDHKGQRPRPAFHIVIVMFVNAQPEHYPQVSVSAGTDF